MNDEKQTPRSDYSVDEILAEAHILKNSSPPENSGSEEQPVQQQKPAAPLSADEIVKRAHTALNMETGSDDSPEPPAPKKEKGFSLFRRNRKKSTSEDMQEDIYYGLQLKSLEEYRRDYEKTIQPDSDQSAESDAAKRSSFPYLFNDSDENLSESFEKIHQERQERLEKIMKHAGLDTDEMFGADDAALQPKIPPNPPRPNIPTPQEPPVPPSVEPGPAMEPEIKPPIIEPPISPAPAMRESPDSKEHGEPQPEAELREETESAEKEPEEDRSPAGGQADQAVMDEPAAPVKEPAVPPQAKDETPVPPPEREPAERPVPPYRAGGLPLHIIELDVFDDVLAAEAADYSPEPVKTPEPISFPAPNGFQGEAENPDFACTARRAEDLSEEDLPEDRTETKTFPIPERQPEKSKKHFRLFGSDEEANDPIDEPPPEQEELDDYSNPADAPSVLNDLASDVRKFLLRLAVTGICAVIAAAFSIVWEHPSVLPPELHSLFGPQACLTVHFVFLVIAAAFCAPAIWNGIRGLFLFQANSDSAAAVAAIAAAVQNIVFFVTGFPSGQHIYAALAIAALFLNTAGKLSMSRRLLRNFKYLSSPEQKYAVQLFGDYNTALQLAKECTVGEPKIAYQAKTGFLKNFLSLSYSPDPSDHASQVMAPIGFIASLGLCIVTAVLTKNTAAALTAFTASACVCIPFSNTLSVSVPLSRISKISAHCGAMTVGWPAVEQFSSVNAVMVDAKDLFPRGTVILNGIQTFAGQRIDEAITDATALAACAGGPLSDLFSQIVKSRKDILPEVKRPEFEDGMGITGTVSDRLILVGNRALLQKHEIDAPSRDYEEKYVRAGKIPVYLAAGGILVAMFLVSYRSDRSRAIELRRLEYNGISLIVRTRDPNITPRLLAECFGISEHSVSVLPERLGEVYSGLVSDPPERYAAYMATKGRAVSMMRLLTACIRQKSNITVAVALQTAGAALGFALVAFFAAYAGLSQLSATSLFIFEAFWTAAVLLAPRIRRP